MIFHSIVDHIKDGETIMTDRGFDITDHLGEHKKVTNKSISLLIPPFKKRKKDKGKEKGLAFSKQDITRSRLVAHHRIIVENCISWLKKWKILSGNIIFELMPILSKIIRVVCFLTNLKHYVSLHVAKYRFISK